MSKKNLPKDFTVFTILAGEIRFGDVYSLKDICYFTGFTKQRLTYWLDKFVEEGLLKQPDRGFYRMTEHGKRIYDQYERYQNKQLVRIENMHVSYYIYEGIKKLRRKVHWKKSKMKNDVYQYNSKIDNHTVRLIYSNDKPPKLQVYVTKVLGETPSDAYYHARLEADSVAEYVEYKFGCKMSTSCVSSEPEIAIPSPIASAILTKYGASQIRTDKGIMNRSKGRGADIEPRNLQQAQKIVDMPDVLNDVFDLVNELRQKLDRPYPMSYHAWWL
ncbi:MAG: hypothetical protein K5798_03920 [Nitrosopumilus sp.]|uniref:hypothetical protein n=1 Tax=Nitrosopumilus sp. TaxID=2024843 RepID=UPI00242D4635|nr:hypothetical protein [Nitrosopumilus sp.]MCV0366400.1 hypothetical protein [Nitrosopumilus sp.]